ncbi:BTAD domain-containing putative transcriptional regulator [Actinoplanes sp. NPDC049265]|uniref:AfsR/SARP family transcriptional regulator n=1 Tax=Actinoplanes sp. NPDC049265 TaxID=3363902 RepID=UPI003722895D
MAPDDPASIRFALLGPVRVTRVGPAGDEQELNLGPRQQRLVLALLLARAGTLVTMTELIAMLWPADAPASAANAVHRQIGSLRRILEPGLPPRSGGRYLHREGAGYRLRVSADTLDLLAFREAAAQARTALEAGDADQALRRSLAALRQWRGRCAAGLEPVSLEHPAFTVLEAEHVRAVRVAADAAAAGGNTAAAGGGTGAVLIPLRQAADEHPLDEGLQSRLLVALAASGRQAEALDRYREVRARLAEELGVGPGAELREAYDRLLHQRFEQRAPAVPPSSPAPRPDPTTPAQLPPDLPFFTGRAEPLAEARRMAERGGGVLAIDGMPGVGKTALSVHLAHTVAGHYPDGQLYVDLRGYDGHGPAMTPAEALRGFLGSLGVPQDRVPAELHAQAGMFRSTVAGRRLLIVLDNCRDADQVRNLLPGTPGCLVVANSRSRLTGLVTGFGAHPIRLTPPDVAEAREGLRHRLGRRATREPGAVGDILAACGRLPLALAVVCARAANRPDTPLAAIAAELAEAQGSLDGFGEEGTDTDLRAVFSWSYRSLTEPAARLFRLLPEHPGPDLSATAAAALAGVPLREGRALLGELDRAGLVAEHRPGRFLMHDLLRAYASELSEAADTETERTAAAGRIAAFYRDTILAGHRVLARWDFLLEPLDLPKAGETPLDGADRDTARDWFDTEREVLLALVGRAAADDRHGPAWLLVIGLQPYFDRSGRALDWAAAARLALAAAIRAGDRYGEARMRRSLAGALYFLQESEQALGQLAQARELLAQLDSPSELSRVGINQGMVLRNCGRHEEALAVLEESTREAEAIGDRLQVADALTTRADSLVALGRLDEALELAERARHDMDRHGDAFGLGDAWMVIGQVQEARRRPAEAVRAWRKAVASFRAASAPTVTAEVLTMIGDTLAATGDRSGADRAWREALDLTSQAQTAAVRALRDRLLRGAA